MQHKKSNQAKRIGVNLLAILGIYLFLSTVSCIFLFFSSNPTGNIPTASLIAFLLSGVISGFSLGKFNRDSRHLAIVASLIFTLVFIAAGVFFSGKLIPVLLNCFAFAIAFNLLLLLAVTKKKKRKLR